MNAFWSSFSLDFLSFTNSTHVSMPAPRTSPMIGQWSARRCSSAPDRRDRRSAAHRVAAIGEAVGQHVGQSLKRRLQSLVNCRNTKREVPRGDALRQSHHVWLHACPPHAKPLARAPEARHNLVDRKEHVVLVAQRAHATEEAGRGRLQPRCVGEWVHEQNREVLRARRDQRLLHCAQRLHHKFLHRDACVAPVKVGERERDDVREERPHGRVDRRGRLQRRDAHRQPVEAAVECDEPRFVRLAHLKPVMARNLDQRLVRLAAARTIEEL
eukprot:3145104-Prymnesium_polylepis.4